MKQRKRLLSVLLVFAMVISLCSSMGTVVAKAAEGGVTLVSRTDFKSKLAEMNATFTGVGTFNENNTTIKSITFEYTAPGEGYTISDVNFAESESEVIHGAYKVADDGSGYDVYFWTDNEAQIMAPESCSLLFCGCSSLETVDLSNFDTSNVIYMDSMFYECSSLMELDLSNFDTSNVTNMSNMVYGCNSLEIVDLSGFDMSNITMETSNINFSRRSNLKRVNLSNVIAGNDTSSMFYECSSLEIVDLSGFDTSNVTDMDLMFSGCSSLTELDLSSFNTSKVTDMHYMFQNCSSLKALDLSSFDTSNVTDMDLMFSGCSSLTELDLSSFNTSNVTTMGNMLHNCSSLETINLSGFDMSNIPFTSRMFYGCSSLKEVNLSNVIAGNDISSMFYGCSSLETVDLSGIDTSNVTDMGSMFQECSSLAELDLSSFNTSNVTDMSSMFQECSSLTELNLSSFNTSNVTNMSSMFEECNALEVVDVTSFDTSNVTNMDSMFDMGWGYSVTTNLKELDLSNFNTSNVTDMNEMFYNCSSLETLNLSKFDTANVTDMYEMFYNCSSLKKLDLPGFDTSKVTDMSSMFYKCSSLEELDLTAFDTSNVTDMCDMFSGCNSLTKLDVTSFDTSNVTDMGSMFLGCNNVIELDVTKFDTSNVTDMGSMFSGCNNVTELDVTKFDTSDVTDMQSMFSGCNNVTELDVINFDTSNVTDMRCMFSGCNNVTELDVTKFDTSKVTDMESMFHGCSSLEELNVTSFDTSNVGNMQYMFYGCSSLKELDVSGFDTSNVRNMAWTFSGCKYLPVLDLSNFTIGADCTAFRPFDGQYPARILYTPKSYQLATKTYIGNYAQVDENGIVLSIVDSLDNTMTESIKLNKIYNIQYQMADGSIYTLEPKTYVYGYGGTVSDKYEWLDADGNEITEISSDTYGDVVLTQKENGVMFVSAKDFANKMLEMNPEFSGLGSYSETNTNIKSIIFAYTAPGADYTISEVSFSMSQSKVIHGAYKKTEDGSGYDVYFWAENEEQIMAPNDCGSLFLGCKGVCVIDVSNFDTSNVIDMRYMFSGCRDLTELDVSGFDTSKVTNMSAMFQSCSSLAELNVSGFDTSNVTRMGAMFNNCSSLIELDVSGFNTSNVTDMFGMFSNCRSLTELDVSKFDTSNVTDMNIMFDQMKNLHMLDLSSFTIRPDYQVEGRFQLLNGTARILYTPKSYPLDTPATIGSYAYIDENGTIVDMFELTNTLTESIKLSRKYSIIYEDAEGNELSDLEPSSYLYGYGGTISDKYEWLDADGNVVTEISPETYGDVILTQKASESTPTPSPSPTPEVTPTPETPSTTPTVTPLPTVTPTPATGPSITVTPTPTPSPSPTPEMSSPTPTPAHTHSLQCIPAVAATCTTAGNQAYYICTVTDCGKVFIDEAAQKETTLQAVVIPALGHNFNEATCLTPSTCVLCGITQGSARGHNYSGATCTQDSVCYDCGAYGESAYGHSFEKATCTKASTCVHCGTTKGSALGHLLEENWSCDEERHWKNCTRSGCVVDREKHTAGDWIVTEEDGYEVHRKYCTVCEKELVKIDMGDVFHSTFDMTDKKDTEYEGSVTVPVTGNGEVQATVDVKDKVASVNDFSFDAWKKSTKEDGKEKVVAFDFSGLDAYIEAVSLTKDLLRDVLNEVKDEKSQTKGMEFGLTTGTVQLDAKALQAVVAQAHGKDVQLHVDDVGTERLNEAQNKAIEHLDVHGGIEAYFMSSNERIGDFKGGNVTVKIPFSIPKKLEAAGFSVWYVDKNGQTTKYACTYEDGYLVFTVDHFSDFLIVYDAEDVIDEEELARATEAENFAVAFAPLRLKVAKVSKTTQELEWKVCDEADGYVIYGSKDTANTDELIPLTVIRDKDTTTWTRYDLTEGTYYAYVIKAYKLVNDEMQFVTQSKTVYATTNGGEHANAKRIQLNTNNFIMQKGSSFELVAEEVILDGKQKKFANLYFVSSDEKVASVDENGVITAKKAGVCQIYVMAQNGVTYRLCVVVEK